MTDTRTYDLGDDLAFWVVLHRVHRLGSVRFGLLEAGFERMEDAWHAEHRDLVAAGLDRRTATALVDARGQTDPVAELERLHEVGIEPIARVDPRYPRGCARSMTRHR